MSPPDKTDHARGWLYVEGLLLEEKVAQLEMARDGELDAELRGEGVNRAQVPGLEELLARAGALAKENEERGEVDHVRGWAHVETLLAKDQTAAHDDAGKAPSLERLMARATEIASEQAPSDGVAHAVEARAPETEPVAKTRRPVRRMRPVWLAAATLGALLLVFALMNGAAIVAVFEGETIRPDDTWLPWRPPPTPEERAARVRERAFAACGRQQWDECATKLDEARSIDPAGESAPRVVAARTAIADAGTPAPAPEPEPEPLKPRPVP